VPAVGANSRGRIEATVFIPTFNGAAYLERLLTAVEKQDFAEKFEILVIDSGSTDDTLGILARHPLVRLVEIPQKDFGHGRTRNQAAQLARANMVRGSRIGLPGKIERGSQHADGLAELVADRAGGDQVLAAQHVDRHGRFSRGPRGQSRPGYDDFRELCGGIPGLLGLDQGEDGE
jgi:glycosyltransferase involved in cell wall biosynthesis